MDEAKKEKDKERSVIDAGLAGAQTEVVQRYGSAVKEHLVSYSGMDRETGQVLKKGLESISKEKISEKQPYQSVKAQAGYAAEVKTVAKENADKIIAGDKAKVSRTDDLSKDLTSASGQSVGGVNNELFDLIAISEDGSYIEGSARQLKYVGKDAHECCERLLQKKFDKYRNADASIEVPKDFYDAVKAELDQRIAKLNDQIQKAEASGKSELAQRRRSQLEQVKKTKENLKQGKLTSKEAIEARLHPKLSTAKDIAQVSHRAGIEAAKYGAAIGGGISIIQNLVAVVKDEKDPEDAIIAVATDTASSAAISYGTGFTGAAIKGAMQNSESTQLQILSKTNLPGVLVSATLSAARVMKRYYDGEIDGVECFEELGQEGTGMISSAMFATIGQIAIPIPVIGGLIGGMLGYAVASASYSTLLNSMKGAKLAYEQRIAIEQECARQIELIQQYRTEIERVIGEYLTSHIDAFQSSFDGIKSALAIGDVDGFIAGANSISEALGRKAQFHNMQEFDALMSGEDAFKL